MSPCKNSTQKNWTWALWPVVFKLNARSNTGSAAVFCQNFFFCGIFFFGFVFFRSVRFFLYQLLLGRRAHHRLIFLYVSFSFFWSLVQAWGDVKGCFFFRRVKEKDFKLIYKVGLFFLFLNPVTTISTTIFIFRSFLVVVIFFHREVGATSN